MAKQWKEIPAPGIPIREAVAPRAVTEGRTTMARRGRSPVPARSIGPTAPWIRMATGALLLSLPAFPGVPTSLAAQEPDPDPERFAQAIETFTDWDAKNSAPSDAILFVGSSSIRFWDTAEWFPLRTVINRGFGGSHISDVNHYIEETVLRHAPDVVVFYAGDNDVGAGKPPQQVHDDFLRFTSTVLSHQPDTEILFVAIKPSLARWSIWPQMVEANELVRGFTEDNENLHFVDVASPMLGSDGEPIPELFVQDGLHMTEEGYEIWTEVVGGALEDIGR